MDEKSERRNVMKKIKFSVLALVVGVVAQISFSNQAEAAAGDKVVFEDDNLAEVVSSQLGLDDVTEEDLLGLYEIYTDASVKITSLKGLEHAVNLESISIESSAIADFSPISDLEYVDSLTVNNNEVSNSNLVEITSGLQNVSYLSLQGNGISDVSAFGKLSNLVSLDLSNNNVSKLSGLTGLTSLTTLTLSNNKISDLVGIDKLSQLTTLYLSGNSVKDVSSLSKLTKLSSLNLDNNNISTIAGLEKLTNIFWLDLSGNNISDISPLAKLKNLQMLLLSNNKITNVKAITDLSGLFGVALEQNPLNLSKGSVAYQDIQTLLKKNVSVILDRDTVIKFNTKKVTSNSITIDWSIFENTKQVSNNLTLFLDGKQVAVIDDPKVTEYTFKNLEKGKKYEIRVDFNFNLLNSGGPESVTFNVKAEDVKATEKVIAKPTVVGKTATITYEDINSVQTNGQLVLDLKDYQDNQVSVQLTSEQVKMLQENNVSIEIAREDATVSIPASILGDSEDVNLVVERLAKVEGALAATYDFTIETADGNISEFASPVTLTFTVDETAVTNGDNVKVWYLNETTGEWEYIGGTYANGVVTAETTHFSTYTVFEREVENDDQTGVKKESNGTNEGNELPNTATNTLNWIMFGSLFILLAVGIIAYQIRKERA